MITSLLRSPRAVRFRKWSLRLGLIAATTIAGGFAILPKASRGNDYTVTHVGDSGPGSLRQAILDANAAGAGNHTISFDNSLPANSLVQLASELDHIQVNIVIDGGGRTLSGHNNHQIFFVALGNVTIKNFTLQDGASTGGNGGNTEMAGGGGGGLGAGGAIFVDSGTNVTVENVVFANNAATGGNGGSAYGNVTHSGGGGGGGFHGNGGNGGGDNINGGGGGGGGGLLGNGGSGDSGRAGAGGGGILLDGGDSLSPLPGAGALAGGDGGFNTFPGGDAILPGGGGGGGGSANHGGDGESFGGGGGGGYGGDGGDAGFGGGGGGSGYVGNEGAAGFGGGQGGATYVGGSGGSGYGGAIFVRSGGSLTVVNSDFYGNTVAAGNGGYGAAINGNNGDAAGAGVYVMSGTTLNFQVNTNGSLIMAETIAGDGEVKKLGTGELILSGTNTYTGATTVDAGRLAINGSVTSSVTVNSGGTLGGNGDITGNLTSNGIVAPGNSIGQLNVVGLYQQNPGSQLEIEINDAGQNDVVNVQGDVILNGGTVSVKAAPGNYSPGQSYTFLTYSGTLMGVGYQGITDDLAFFDAMLQYGVHDISFFLQPNQNDFADIGQTFNEIQVGTDLDNHPNSALQPIMDEMYLMTNSQVRNSLNQMSGEIYGTTSQVQFQNTTNQMQMLAQQMRPSLGLGGFDTASSRLPATNEMLVSFDRTGELVIRGQSEYMPRYTTWGTGYGLGGNAQTNGNAAGLDYALGGVIAGIDRALDDRTLVGAYGGYNYGQIDGIGLTQRVQANSGQFGGYFRREDGCNYTLLASGMSFDAYDSSRTIGIGAFNAVASANYDGWQSATYLEKGRTFNTGYGLLQPYAALQYIYLRQNSFSETGGGAVGLDVAGVDANSLRSVLGMRASRDFTTSHGLVFVPQVRAAWLHEFLETDTLINNRFGSVAGSSFAAKGLDLGRDWALLGGGMGWRMTQNWTLTGNYDAQVNERQVFHIGSANVQYVW